MSRASAPGTTSSSGSSRLAGTARRAPGATPTCVMSGALLMMGSQIDGTHRHHCRQREPISGPWCAWGPSPSTPWSTRPPASRSSTTTRSDRACLVGCGVTTGWGSSVYAGEVRPGDDVVVIGIGGIGASAIQGARLAGAERIFAIDPVPFKREMATKFGATHTAASIEEALGLVNEVTWGKNADKVICTMGVGDGRLMETIMQLTAKRGRVVVTNIHPMAETDVTFSLTWLTLFEKQMVGTIFGSANIRYDIPHLLRLYDQGQLDLDGMVTRTYKLEDVNLGYADMLDGKNIRGVLQYE